MKPIQGILVEKYDKIFDPGSPLFILGKWEQQGIFRSGAGYLIYEPTTEIFLHLDASRVKIEDDTKLFSLPHPCARKVIRTPSVNEDGEDHLSTIVVIPESELSLTEAMSLIEESTLIYVLGRHPKLGYMVYDFTTNRSFFLAETDFHITKQGVLFEF
jgi:hypothetical protein